jgi:hypothetical protein
MRSSLRLALLLALGLSALAPAATAGTVVGLEIIGGYSGLALDDMNTFIGDVNQTLGSDFGSLHGGTTTGFGLRIWPTDRWMLRVVMDMVTTELTSSSAGEMSFDPMPSFNTLDITYFFLESKPFRVGIGAGGGVADLDGAFKTPGFGGKYDITGDGPEGHALLETDFMFSKRAAVTLQGGYRLAKVPDVQFDDVSADPKLEADLSGPYVRVGFSYDWR